MRFGSVCSGIEAASVAWPFWEAAWFSEIEPFPCAVLKHHYPEVPNHGDMTMLPDRILSGEVEAPDVFCGGTPCQAFSVAGNRKSLDDARGNLSLTFCEIADAIDTIRQQRNQSPAIIFWENVPGCLNTKDNFFGCFLAKLCGATEALEIENGKWPTNGVIVGERRRVAWATLDARWFGLAQRRKRVFVVAYDNALVEHFGMPCPSEILSLGSRLPRNPTEGGKTRQGIAADAESGAWWDGGQVAATLTVEGAGGNQRMPDKGNLGAVLVPVCAEIAPTIKRDYGKGYGDGEMDGGGLICAEISPTVTNGAPFSRTGNERVECDALVTYGIQGNMIGRADTAGPQGSGYSEELTHTLDQAQGQVAVPTYSIRPDVTPKFYEDIAGTIGATDYKDPTCVSTQYAVRRLTPVECERLQGFPDNYTNIPWRKKPESPDGPRYKALGNSWAVPVVRWIGERINNAVNRL